MPTVCSTMPDTSCTHMIHRLRQALHSLLIASGISKTSSRNVGHSRRSLNCSGFRGRPVSGWNASSTELSDKPMLSSRLPLQISHFDNRFLALQIHDPNTNATWIVNCKDASEVFKTVNQAIEGETDKAPDFFVSPRRR